MLKRITAISLAAALWLGSQPVRAVAPQTVDVLAFSLNPALIINLYNVAQQHDGVITSYPADQDPAILSATLVNGDTQNSHSPNFNVLVKRAGQTIVTGGILTLKTPLAPGERRVCNANDFLASGSFSGSVDDNFRSEIEAEFNSLDPAKLPQIVDKYLKQRFTICLQPTGPNSTGVTACTDFTLFTGNTAADCSVAVLVYPHNNAVPNNLPTFVWAPAYKNNCEQGRLSYIIEVLKEGLSVDQPGPLIARIRTQPGATFYQWQASDPVLEENTKYYYRVISLDCNGAPFCGPGGNGWNILKWFLWQNKGAAVCRYTLADIDRFVREKAKPEIRDELKRWLVTRMNRPGTFDDPFVCRVLSGLVPVTSIELKK